MLTRQNYRQEIGQTILGRGRAYYEDGHITDLEEIEENHWSATVDGSFPYKVTVQETDGQLACTCTCPYDRGLYCKHIAAVLVALEIEWSGTPPKAKKPRKKRKTRSDKIREAMEGQTKEQLVSLLIELTNQDSDLANLILARFGSNMDNKKAVAQLVKKAIKSGTDRDGFIGYWESTAVARAIDPILKRGEDALDIGNIAMAQTVYEAVFEKTLPVLQYADDSNGEIGGAIAHSVIGFGKIAELVGEQADSKERMHLFTYLLDATQNKDVQGWDWWWDCAYIAADLVISPDEQTQLFETIDRMAESRDREWSRGYDREKADRIKLSFVEKQEDSASVQAFMEERVDQEWFRLSLADWHIERKNYETAKQLAQAWLDVPDQRKPGLRKEFYNVLLRVAELEEDEPAVLRIAEDLFLNEGDFKYYDLLKERHSAETWPPYLKTLIPKISDGGWMRILPDVYIREEMWHELLKYVQKKPHLVYDYHSQLALDYPSELIEIYARHAQDTMNRASNREKYKDACSPLIQIARLGDPDRARAIGRGWLEEHPRRPAMKDEINKVLSKMK